MAFVCCYKSVKIMNILISIIWLGGGTVWFLNAIKNPTSILCWILAVISFAASIYYAKQFDKQLRE